MLGIVVVYLADSNKNRNKPTATQHICLAKNWQNVAIECLLPLSGQFIFQWFCESLN